jgi:hypothetical protein
VISLLNQLSFCPPDKVQRHWDGEAFESRRPGNGNRHLFFWVRRAYIWLRCHTRQLYSTFNWTIGR